MSKIQRQIELEERTSYDSIAKFRDTLLKAQQNNRSASVPGGIAVLHQQLLVVAFKIIEELKDLRGNAFLKIIKDVDPYVAAFESLRVLINHSSNSTNSIVQMVKVAEEISRAIQDNLAHDLFKKHEKYYVENFLAERYKQGSNKSRTIKALKSLMTKKGIIAPEWSVEERVKIGTLLIQCVIESTGLFYLEQKKKRGSNTKSIYTIQATDELLHKMEQINNKATEFSTTYLPMITQPKDWDGYYGGGFLSSLSNYRIPFIRARSKEAKELAIDTLDETSPIIKAVNILQRTPYKINTKVKEVMESIVELGGGSANIPASYDQVVPPKPWGEISDEEWKKYRANPNNAETIAKWKFEKATVLNNLAKTKSQRLALNAKLKIANQFKEEPEIFFVWTADWRGRLYPVQTHINPQSDDIGKSLLLFAEGKGLGWKNKGLKWLKIHGANTYGEDKVSFDKRVKWVDEHESMIKAIASDPMGNLGNWEDADKPFGFLAFCFEYARYLEDPENFVSYLPIAVDGSNNGLQHLSAMLKDSEGARATNLEPQEVPADIYTEVLNKVQPKLEELASKDIIYGMDSTEQKNIEAARYLLKEGLTRKHTKRNTMTYAYSVTARGMIDQLRDDFGLSIKNASLLAEENLRAIESTVKSAAKAMHWLQEVARYVTSKHDKSLRWTTPSSFNVLQNEKKVNIKRVNSYYGGARLRLHTGTYIDKLNGQKQKLGIAPNFVHSYDAAHMHLTIIECANSGVTAFAMIHDSFGTHACDLEVLNHCLREQFMEIYSINVLDKFKKEIEEQIGEELPFPTPTMGDFDIDTVLTSKYFFA